MGFELNRGFRKPYDAKLYQVKKINMGASPAMQGIFQTARGGG